MDEVPVDIDEAGAIGTPFDDVRVPDLFVKGAKLNHRPSP
jgi:hypothetical protein